MMSLFWISVIVAVIGGIVGSNVIKRINRLEETILAELHHLSNQIEEGGK